MRNFVQKKHNITNTDTNELILFPTLGRNIKLMKGKACMKHSLHEEKAASVLLKPFISGNKGCHTTDAPLAHERNSFSKCKQHTIHDPRGPEKYNYTMM